MTARVGLYSIGIRGLDLTAVLTLAAEQQVPFVHLRGGPRGYDLARREDPTLSRWARHSQASVPITLVTTELDIAQFQPASHCYQHAGTELDRVGRVSAILGAHAVRLLARHPVHAVPGTVTLPDLRKRHGVVIVVELHDPSWFTPDALIAVRAFCDAHPGVGLLVDSGQLHRAWSTFGSLDGLVVGELVARALVVHLCDNGSGLGGTGHHLLAAATAAVGGGVEVGFEWTGPDRSPLVCLARYRAAVSWWQHAGDTP